MTTPAAAASPIPVEGMDEHLNRISPELGGAFLAGVLAVREAPVLVELAKDWIKNGFRGDLSRLKSLFLARAVEKAKPLLEAGFHAGVEAASDDFQAQMRQNWAPVASAWARAYAESSLGVVADTNNEAVTAHINAGLNQRLPATVIAERVAMVYGLDPRTAATVFNKASRKNQDRTTNIQAESVKALVQRSLTLGDIHTMSALNAGRQALYMLAMEHGLLPESARKVWVTAIDERVCEVCRPMDGVAVPLEEPFHVVMPIPKTGRGSIRKSAHVHTPPVHPNCRCTIVPEERFREGIITRTARFRVVGPRKRADLVSRVEDLIFQKRDA